MARLQFAIEGMSCGHCVAAVEKALAALPGVAASRVAVGSAQVEYDPARVSVEQMAATIRGAGFAPRAAE